MKIALELQPILKEKTGVGWYTYQLVKELSNRNIELNGKVFNFLGRNSLSDSLKEITFNIETCKLMPYGAYSRLWNRIPVYYDQLFSTKADIYHFFNFVFPPRIAGKVVVTVYDMVYKTFPETMTKANLRRLNNNLLRSCQQADAIITISKNSKEEIVQYLQVSAEKVFVVPPGVNLRKFHSDFSEEELSLTKDKYGLPEKYFLYLGTLEPRKNINLIIKAYHRLIKDKKDQDLPKLVIAGKKGWLFQDLFQLVQEYGLGNQIFFPGYILDEDVPRMIKGAIAFIFPSLYEGFGMPPLEAMACGVPVIVSNTSSLPEVVGEAGILVNPYSDEELSREMFKIIDNQLLRKELVLKGFEQVKQFTWERAADLTIDIYSKLV